MRRYVAIVLTFIGGAYFVLEFIIPAELTLGPARLANPLSPYIGLATDLIVILGTMAFLLGPINLVRVHLAAAIRRRPGWISSIVFLVFLAASVTAASGREWTAGTGTHAALRWDQAYNVFFYGINFAFGTSSMGLLTFYLVSAAYRSFRLTSLDAGVMMIAATIVLLGLSPVGDWLTQGIWEPLQLRSLARWIMETPNTAVQRAVVIGTCAGAFAAALRHWLSLGGRTE